MQVHRPRLAGPHRRAWPKKLVLETPKGTLQSLFTTVRTYQPVELFGDEVGEYQARIWLPLQYQ